MGVLEGKRKDSMKKEVKQQFTRRITQANSTELVVILYEMLLCYLEDGEKAIEHGEAELLREAARNARGCLNELMNSLNLNYEPAPALQRLYMFCFRRMARAEQRMDCSPIDEIRRVIKPLRDAYEKLAAANNAGPVMRNSQTVYAGLTYGKNTLTENMADQGTNRGILA